MMDPSVLNVHAYYSYILDYIIYLEIGSSQFY